MKIKFPSLGCILLVFSACMLGYCCYTYRHLVETFVYGEDPVLNTLHARLSVLHPKLRDIPVRRGSTSETIDKKRIYICARDDSDRYYSDNMLTYVLLHEYAHVLCNEMKPDNPHTDKFHLIWKTLLQDAAQRGLYNPNIPPLKKYCGVEN